MVSVSPKAGVRQLRVNKHVAVTSWPRLVARSSETRAPSIDGEGEKWLDGVAWSVADRLRNDGDVRGGQSESGRRAMARIPV